MTGLTFVGYVELKLVSPQDVNREFVTAAEQMRYEAFAMFARLGGLVFRDGWLRLPTGKPRTAGQAANG